MRLKMVFLDQDELYLTRVMKVFQRYLSDKVDIFAFTEEALLHEFMSVSRPDVLLLNEKMAVNLEQFSTDITVMVLVESHEITEFDGLPAVCKYQRPITLYQEALAACLDSEEKLSQYTFSSQHRSEIIAFYGVAGGVGTSTASVAYCIKETKQGKKVLYLTVDPFISASLFFHDEGRFRFSDVVYWLKSKQLHLSKRLEIGVCSDQSGIDFFKEACSPLDMAELTANEMNTLLEALQMCSKYDKIVIDQTLQLDDMVITVVRKASRIVLVANGLTESNQRMERQVATLRMLRANLGIDLDSNIYLLLNRWTEVASNKCLPLKIQCIGKIPEFCKASPREIAEQIARTPDFFLHPQSESQ